MSGATQVTIPPAAGDGISEISADGVDVNYRIHTTDVAHEDGNSVVSTGGVSNDDDNRGNRVHDGTTLPREQQTEHDSVSPSQENSGEEQRFVASTSRDTISAQARKEHQTASQFQLD